jgi:hypothetical protein
MKDVKKDSWSWIKTKNRGFRNFHWQDGYGAFSIRQADIPTLNEYLAGQKGPSSQAHVSGRANRVSGRVWDDL